MSPRRKRERCWHPVLRYISHTRGSQEGVVCEVCRVVWDRTRLAFGGSALMLSRGTWYSRHDRIGAPDSPDFRPKELAEFAARGYERINRAAPQESRDERWRADQDACEADHESARRCDCPVPDCQHHRGLEPWPQESAPPPSGRAWELPRANQFVRSTRGNWCGRRGDDGREWCGLSELSHPTPSAAASTVGVTVGIPAAGSEQADHKWAPKPRGVVSTAADAWRCGVCGLPREAHRRSK